ncbi:hypothetical protein JCM3765_000513 [Sporobolomyces pararoseus]
MSLATLPAEILDEITFELRTYFGNDNSDSEKAGKALSLVCRRLKPFGQALQWRNTQCHILKTRSLANHFSRFQHLGSLVINFQTTPLDQPLENSQNTKWDLSALSSLLSRCTRLQQLHLRIYRGLPSLKILQKISQIKSLLGLVIYFEDPLEWSPKMASVLAEDFPSLEKLSFEASKFRLPNRRCKSLGSSRQIRQKVQKLKLGWVCARDGEEEEVIDTVISSFDISSVDDITLAGDAACSRMFEQLTTCSRLESIALQLPEYLDRVATLSSLVEVLPRFKDLTDVSLQIEDSSEAFSIGFPLSRLLEAWTPSLERVFVVADTLGDYDSIAKCQIEMPIDWTKYQTVAMIAFKDEGGPTVTTVWRAKDSGNSKWYRQNTEKI